MVRRNQGLLETLGLDTAMSRAIGESASRLGVDSKISGAGLGGIVLAFVEKESGGESLPSVLTELGARYMVCVGREVGTKRQE